MNATINNLNYRTAAVDELVRAAQDDDRQAFGELARRFEGMIYALALRPFGFMLSTVAFLVFGGILLGERRLVVLFVFPVLVSYIVWQLLNTLLGVHLPPYPIFLGGG